MAPRAAGRQGHAQCSSAAGGPAGVGAEEEDLLMGVGGIAELPGLWVVVGGYVLGFGTNGTAVFLRISAQISRV
jgi:hypothetical protein